MAHRVTIDGIDIRVDLHEGGGGTCYVIRPIISGAFYGLDVFQVATGDEFSAPEWEDRKQRAIAIAWDIHGDAFLAAQLEHDIRCLDGCRSELAELQRKAAKNASARSETLADIQRLRRKLGV